MEQVLAKLETLDVKLQGLSDGHEEVQRYVHLIYDHVTHSRTSSSARHRCSSEEQVASSRSAWIPTAERTSHGMKQRHRTVSLRGPLSTIHRLSPHGELDGSCPKGYWPRTSLTQLKKPNGMYSKGRTFMNLEGASASATKKIRDVRQRFLPLHPESWYRAAFDSFSVILLLYDSLVIPYQFAWQPPFDGWLRFVTWSNAAFWAVDLILGFITGYYEEHRVVLSLSKIAKHYIRTGFVMNLLVVMVDFAGNILEELNVANDVQMLKTVLRLLRFVKLTRILKLSSLWRQGKVAQALDAVSTAMREKGVHEQFEIVMRVLRLVFAIMWMNHFGCCVWHAFGPNARAKWLNDQSMADPDMGDDLSYMIDAYWTAHVLVSGASVMIPTTRFELFTAVCGIVFGFIFTSMLISSLLSSVIAYQEANKDRTSKLTALRQFLYQHKVASKIALPIVKQARERMACRKRLNEGDVEALQLLSQPLRSGLWNEIYGPRLAEHPYFNACRAVDAGLIGDICYTALDHTPYHLGDPIFEPRQEAKGTLFVTYGTLEYRFVSLDHDDPFEAAEHEHGGTIVKKGVWISEVALFANWVHRGWLDATTHCELLTLQPENLVKVIGKHPKLISLTQSYSSRLLEALDQEPHDTLTDLVVPVAHSSVMAALPHIERQRLSEGAVALMQRSPQWTAAATNLASKAKQHTRKTFSTVKTEDVIQEVADGSCDFVLDSVHAVIRVVKSVGIRLINSDGAVLTQIGLLEDGTQTAECKPPLTRVKGGEFPRQALNRLVAENLSPFVDGITLGGPSEEVDWRTSESCGIQTRHYWTLYEASFESQVEDWSVFLEVLPRNKMKMLATTSSECFRTQRTASEEFAGTSSFSFAKLSRQRSFPKDFKKGPRGTYVSRSKDPTAEYEAFVFREGPPGVHSSAFPIYAWLAPDDFELLCSRQGAEFVERWMEELSFEECSAVFRPCKLDSELSEEEEEGEEEENEEEDDEGSLGL